MEFDIYLFLKFLKHTMLIILGILTIVYLASFLGNLVERGFKYAYVELIKLIGLVVFAAILFAIKI